jgi:hypothetical protein
MTKTRGIVCPGFKNGGKPKDDPNSYRKITISSCVGKVVEKIHLFRNENRILSVVIAAHSTLFSKLNQYTNFRKIANCLLQIQLYSSPSIGQGAIEHQMLYGHP